MGKYKNIISINIGIFIILGSLMGVLGLAGVGAVGIVLGTINLLIGFIVMLIKPKRHFAPGYLICGGVLLLIGFSLCTAFPLRLN